MRARPANITLSKPTTEEPVRYRDREMVGTVEQVDGAQIVRDTRMRLVGSVRSALPRPVLRAAAAPRHAPSDTRRGCEAGAFHRLAIARLACAVGGVLDDRVGAMGDPLMPGDQQMLSVAVARHARHRRRPRRPNRPSR